MTASNTENQRTDSVTDGQSMASNSLVIYIQNPNSASFDIDSGVDSDVSFDVSSHVSYQIVVTNARKLCFPPRLALTSKSDLNRIRQEICEYDGIKISVLPTKTPTQSILG